MTGLGPVATTVDVSWDGSATFGGPHDNVTPWVCGEPGLAITIGKDGARTMDPPQVLSFDFEVFNHTGRFSPERPDSPIQQQILPGRPVRAFGQVGQADVYRGSDAYRADDFYRGVATYGMGVGAIDEIGITTDWGNQRVSFRCLGTEQVLVAGTVTIGVMTAPRVDQCITAILDAVGWPASRRAISASDTTLAYWWADDRQPWAALVELLLSEGPGALYVDGDGILHFENRNYRSTTPRSQSPQAAFWDTSVHPVVSYYREHDAYRGSDLYRAQASGLWFTDLRYDPGYASIRNRATYATRQRTLGATAVVWSYGAPLALAAGQSVTLIAKPTDPFQNAVTPAATTDYTVSGGAVSVSLSAGTGLVAFVTITATSGTPTVSGPAATPATGIQLRAQPLTAGGDTIVHNAVDASASIAKYSPIPGAMIPRVFDVAGWPEIGIAMATAVCDAWVVRYMVPRPAVEITLYAGDEEHAAQILDRDVSDRITVIEANSGLSGDVWVNGKTITVSGSGGRIVTAVLRCETCDDVEGSLWNNAQALWGTSDADPNGAIWGI